MEIKSRIDFAIETSKLAGALLMENFGKQNEPQWTAETNETNFKIVMDKKSDDLIRSRIAKYFPEDDIYSEEAEDINRGKLGKWVFDPLDGTIPYTIHSSNNWSVAISYVEDRTPVIGVVYMPQREELYTGIIGEGAFCNDIPLKVSAHSELKKINIGIDGGKQIKGWFNKSSMKILRDGLEGVATFLASGCASVPLCRVASGTSDQRLPTVGRLEAYIGGALEPFDMVAEVPIIREAGGKVTHLSGREWKFSPLYKGDPTILVANLGLHEKILNHLGKEIDKFYSANGFGKYS